MTDPWQRPPSYEPAPPPRRGWSPGAITALVIGVVLVLLLAGGGVALAAWRLTDGRPDAPSGSASQAPPSPSSTVPMPAAPQGLDRFYDQELRWRACGGDRDCAWLRVPLDYAEPSGRSIRIAVLRVKARERDKRVGQLVVNPGGPGGSGVEYASAGTLAFGSTVTRFFDVIGFDPRGVGQSTPLKCLGTRGLDEVLAADPDPDTPQEVDRLGDLTRGFGEGCLDKSGELTRHMSTEEVVKDLDVLRAALGEPQLDYFGASYGTLIGATYADMFPGRVRRMVLDGAIDPSLSNEQLSLGQARGFETALRAYVKSCVDQGSCVLGDSVDEGTRRIAQLLRDVEERPLRTSTERDLTAGWAVLGIWLPLYVESRWPELTAALQQAIENRDGDLLLGLADQYASRGPDSYRDNSIEALIAVNCLDHGDFVQPGQVPSYFAEFEKASPTFGRSFAYGLTTCSWWPVKSGERTRRLTAEGAPPIVVTGTTRDPATPYAWAEGLAEQLDSGVLLRRDGDGHTAFNQGNACVDSAIEGYLVRGTVPRDGYSC